MPHVINQRSVRTGKRYPKALWLTIRGLIRHLPHPRRSGATNPTHLILFSAVKQAIFTILLHSCDTASFHSASIQQAHCNTVLELLHSTGDLSKSYDCRFRFTWGAQHCLARFTSGHGFSRSIWYTWNSIGVCLCNSTGCASPWLATQDCSACYRRGLMETHQRTQKH